MKHDKIKILPESEWENLEGIFQGEIGIDLPEPGTARILGVVDEGELQALCVAEKFLRCDNWWVASSYRNTPKSADLILQLARFLLYAVPKGTSAVIIASNEHQEEVFQRMKFVRVPGTLYRIDVE